MKTRQVLRNAASTSFFGSMKLIWVAVCAAVVVGVPAAASPLGQLGVAAALSAAVPRDLNGSWGEQIAQGERRVGAATPDDGEWVWTSSGGSPGGQASTAVSQSRSLFTSLIAPFVGGRQRPRGGHRGREKPRPQIWRPAFTLHPPRPRPPQPTSHHPAGVPPQLLQSGVRDGQPHVFSAIHAPDITSADFPGYPETSLTVGDADSASPVTIDLSEFSEPRPEDVVYIEYEDGGDGANFQQNSGSFIQVSTLDQPNEPVSGFQPPREYSVHGNAVSAHSSTENVKLSEVFSPPSFNVEEKFSKPFATVSATENSLNLQNDNVYVTADTSLHDDSHGAQDPPAPHHHHQATQPSTSPPPPPPRSSPLRQQFNHLQIIPSQPDHQIVPSLPSYSQTKQQPLSSPSQPKQQTLASPSQLKKQTLPSSPEQHTLSSLSLDSLPKQQKPSSPPQPKQQTLSSPSQPKQQTLSSPSQPKQQTPSPSLHLQPKQQTSSSSQPKQQTPSSSSQPKQQTPSPSSQPKQQTPSPSSQPKQQTPPSQPKQQTLSTPSHPSQPTLLPSRRATEIQPLSSKPRTTPPAPQQQEPPRSWVKKTRVTLTSSPSSHPERTSQEDFVTSPAKRQVPGSGHRLPQTPGHGHRLTQTTSNRHSSPQTPIVPARMREASSSSQEHLSSVGSFAPLPAFTQDELGSPAATTAGFLPFEDSSEFFDHVFEGRSPFGEKVQTEKPGSPSKPTSRPFRRSTPPLASTPTLHSLSYTESLSATLTPSSQTSSFSSIIPPFQPPEPSSHPSTASSLSEEVFPASVNDLPLETTKSTSSILPWTTLTGPLAREQDRIEEEGTAVAGQFSPVGKDGHNTRLATSKPTTAHTRPGRNSGDAPVTPSGIPSLSTREAVSLGVREKPRPVTTSSAENTDFDVLVLPYEAVDGNYDVDQTTTISTTHQPVQYSQTTKPEEVDVFLVRRTRPSLGWLNIPTPRPDLPPHPQPQHNTITTRIQVPPITSSHVSRPETTRVREPLVSVGPASEDGGRPVHEHPQHHQQQQRRQHQEFPNIFGLKRPQPGGRDLPLDQDDPLKRPLNHDGHTSDLTLGHDGHTSDLTLGHDDHTSGLTLGHDDHTSGLTLGHDDHTSGLTLGHDDHTSDLTLGHDDHTSGLTLGHDDHTSDLTLGHDDHTSDLTLGHDDHTSDLTLGHDDHDFKQSLSHDHSLDLPVDNVDHSFERPVDQAGHNLTLPSHNHHVRETTAADDGLPAEGVRSRDNGGPSHSSLVSSKEPGGFPQVLGSLTPPSSTTCDHGFCHDFANDQDNWWQERLLEISNNAAIFTYSELHSPANDSLFYDPPQPHDRYVCSAEVRELRPAWGRAADGNFLRIINTDSFPQRIRMEVCSDAGEPCTFLPELVASACRQRYSVHKMAAVDPQSPADGVFLAAFKVPSGCFCHVSHTRDSQKSAGAFRDQQSAPVAPTDEQNTNTFGNSRFTRNHNSGLESLPPPTSGGHHNFQPHRQQSGLGSSIQIGQLTNGNSGHQSSPVKPRPTLVRRPQALPPFTTFHRHTSITISKPSPIIARPEASSITSSPDPHPPLTTHPHAAFASNIHHPAATLFPPPIATTTFSPPIPSPKLVLINRPPDDFSSFLSTSPIHDSSGQQLDVSSDFISNGDFSTSILTPRPIRNNNGQQFDVSSDFISNGDFSTSISTPRPIQDSNRQQFDDVSSDFISHGDFSTSFSTPRPIQSSSNEHNDVSNDFNSEDDFLTSFSTPSPIQINNHENFGVSNDFISEDFSTSVSPFPSTHSSSDGHFEQFDVSSDIIPENDFSSFSTPRPTQSSNHEHFVVSSDFISEDDFSTSISTFKPLHSSNRQQFHVSSDFISEEETVEPQESGELRESGVSSGGDNLQVSMTGDNNFILSLRQVRSDGSVVPLELVINVDGRLVSAASKLASAATTNTAQSRQSVDHIDVDLQKLPRSVKRYVKILQNRAEDNRFINMSISQDQDARVNPDTSSDSFFINSGYTKTVPSVELGSPRVSNTSWTTGNQFDSMPRPTQKHVKPDEVAQHKASLSTKTQIPGISRGVTFQPVGSPPSPADQILKAIDLPTSTTGISTTVRARSPSHQNSFDSSTSDSDNISPLVKKRHVQANVSPVPVPLPESLITKAPHLLTRSTKAHNLRPLQLLTPPHHDAFNHTNPHLPHATFLPRSHETLEEHSSSPVVKSVTVTPTVGRTEKNEEVPTFTGNQSTAGLPQSSGWLNPLLATQLYSDQPHVVQNYFIQVPESFRERSMTGSATREVPRYFAPDEGFVNVSQGVEKVKELSNQPYVDEQFLPELKNHRMTPTSSHYSILSPLTIKSKSKVKFPAEAFFAHSLPGSQPKVTGNSLKWSKRQRESSSGLSAKLKSGAGVRTAREAAGVARVRTAREAAGVARVRTAREAAGVARVRTAREAAGVARVRTAREAAGVARVRTAREAAGVARVRTAREAAGVARVRTAREAAGVARVRTAREAAGVARVRTAREAAGVARVRTAREAAGVARVRTAREAAGVARVRTAREAAGVARVRTAREAAGVARVRTAREAAGVARVRTAREAAGVARVRTAREAAGVPLWFTRKDTGVHNEYFQANEGNPLGKKMSLSFSASKRGRLVEGVDPSSRLTSSDDEEKDVLVNIHLIFGSDTPALNTHLHTPAVRDVSQNERGLQRSDPSRYSILFSQDHDAGGNSDHSANNQSDASNRSPTPHQWGRAAGLTDTAADIPTKSSSTSLNVDEPRLFNPLTKMPASQILRKDEQRGRQTAKCPSCRPGTTTSAVRSKQRPPNPLILPLADPTRGTGVTSGFPPSTDITELSRGGILAAPSLVVRPPPPPRLAHRSSIRFPGRTARRTLVHTVRRTTRPPRSLREFIMAPTPHPGVIVPHQRDRSSWKL